jgi:nitrogen fixation protein
MSSNYSYRVAIERLRQFAEGHFLIRKFYHGEIAEADLFKEPEYPFMHVLPVTITPSEGTLEYDFEIRFADIGRDKETKQEYQKEIISDCTRLALDLIAEIQNGGVLFGREVEVVGKTATIQPFIEEFTHVLTGVQLNVQIAVPYNWSACDIPADYSPNIIDNPEVNGGILTKIGIYSNEALVGYTSALDFGDDFSVSINGALISVEYIGSGGGLTCETIEDCDVIVNINESIVDLTDRMDAAELAITGKEDVGVAQDIMDDHLAAANPHPQYALDSDLSGYVPYTGATTDVDLGTHNLTADHIALNVNPSGAGFVVGATQWNNNIGSSQTLLKGGNVILKNGVDLVARIVNKVTPNTTLTKASYQAVRVSGATGGRLSVELARADSDINSADTIGLVCETIATNQEGFIITVGQLLDVNTTGSLQGETWADGDVLYLSPTTAGAITKVKPTGVGHIVVIGYVEYAHAVNGSIYVKVMNGWELDELHDVDISNVQNGQWLIYNSGSGRWKNTSVFNYSVNFKDVIQHEVILPYAWKIQSVGSNPSGVTLTIELNGSAYTLGSTIAANTGVITIDTSAIGFINLICERV